MVDLVLGIGAAGGGPSPLHPRVAPPALDAKEAPHGHHLRISLLRGLLTRGRWLIGTGLSILGWPMQVVALLLAPLVVVQPALAAGLVLLLLLSERMLGEQAGRKEHLAV